MGRLLSGCATATFTLLWFVGPAFATPIVGQDLVAGGSFTSRVSSLYNSSISVSGNQPRASAVSGGLRSSWGTGVHQFSLVVPVSPPPPETPEPSSMTLFGTGLIVVASAVRRRARR